MKTFTVRLEDNLEKEFDRIKADLGLKNDAEVIRYLIKQAKKTGGRDKKDTGFNEAEWTEAEKESPPRGDKP